MNATFRCTLEFLGFLFPLMLILANIAPEMDSTVAGWITVILSGGGVALIERLRYKKVETSKRFAEYISTSLTEGTLRLYSIGTELSAIVKYEKHYNYSFKYHPEQIVYTGATVGGITTGGFHKEEAYTSVAGCEWSGKFTLVYNGNNQVTNDKWCPITKIELTTKQLRESAAKLFPDQYKDGMICLQFTLPLELCQRIVSWLTQSNLS
ncbi:MAG: hypothetical protein IKM36_02455 [Oscillospiraceae bacterium]|nr:hypothetical protein [Oscillospiraceae bacterium]MBR3849334.1 hypothetical protein [Oscillospiraceae bacterium]